MKPTTESNADSSMTIRPRRPEDRAEWLRMRRALWPDCSESMHAVEMREHHPAKAGQRAVLVLARKRDSLGGFLELSVRARVDGSKCKEVAYVEGWYVDADLRGRGLGRRLMNAAEQWALAHGLTELASDVELENGPALRAHQALGFRETFRLVHLLKPLK